MSIEIHHGMAALADGYDAILLDLWGVVHNGFEPYPGVIDCLERLRERNRPVVILSNAPRRCQPAIDRLAEMGIARDLYADLLTSGEATWRMLRDRAGIAAALGPRAFHIGPARDRGMLDGIPFTEADKVGDADFLLCTGIYDDADPLERYEAVLQAARGRALPMVCANPDYEVIHGPRRQICAGALARRYEEIGGHAHWVGKPRPCVYALCRDLLDGVAAERVLAVGDSLRTDIAGAQGAGMPAVLVTGGIHAEALRVAHGEAPNPADLDALCEEYGHQPIAALTAFRW